MRFLVVEPERGFAFLLGRALRRMGHEAFLAFSTGDALDMLDAGVDVVVVNGDLPGSLQGSLTRELRRLRPDLPVFLWRAYGDEPGIDESWSLPRLWCHDDLRFLIQRASAWFSERQQPISMAVS